MRVGFLLGSRETLLETKDGGRTWSPRSVAAAQDEGVRACPNLSPPPALSPCLLVTPVSGGRLGGVQVSVTSAQEHGSEATSSRRRLVSET